jgi:hypothetical protein
VAQRVYSKTDYVSYIGYINKHRRLPMSVTELRAIIHELDYSLMYLTDVRAIAKAIEERDECETVLALALKIAREGN